MGHVYWRQVKDCPDAKWEQLCKKVRTILKKFAEQFNPSDDDDDDDDEDDDDFLFCGYPGTWWEKDGTVVFNSLSRTWLIDEMTDPSNDFIHIARATSYEPDDGADNLIIPKHRAPFGDEDGDSYDCETGEHSPYHALVREVVLAALKVAPAVYKM